MVVMIIIMVVMVMMPAHSQHAPDAANDTTGHTANHRTSSCTDWTGYAPTLSCAPLTTAYDTLGLCEERHRKDGKNASG